ncbi:PLP-dependent aminotransferase family protein [Pedobacter sp. MC2016-24]|uniref:aminotransferase-like domain-containing protein n=1 Tax=Pedobacter sp. MC2016-24 TaxID=2780090 RepID=UPI00187EBF65|nr:PLP-dependent aminotransferase family protein [Pedobacter sp. MC2016-24]MBE9600187.1 PLP-dependent aminotransferase family protein [Pedobacter sp. MC2016-24]
MKPLEKAEWLVSKLDKMNSGRDIYNFIVNKIKSGQLVPGSRVPPYRDLAQLNKINRNTVQNAYSKLISNNWLSTSQGSGTFVSTTNPSTEVPHRTSGFTDVFPAGLPHLPNQSVSSQSLPYLYVAVGTDFPSPASFPEDKFAEYCSRHLEASKHLSQAQLLSAYEADYLKSTILEDLNRRRSFGLKANMLDIIKGRELSLNQVFKILISPGDIVINTSPQDLLLHTALEKSGARIYVMNRMEHDFLSRLERLLQFTKVRAIYIRPQFSFPEGHSFSISKAVKLIELAKKYKVCILEEEEDHEFWYTKSPYSPMAGYNHDGFVIYLAALSKAIPETRTLRIVAASAQFIEQLQMLPAQPIESRDIIKEKAIADMIKSGEMAEYARHVRAKSKKFRNELDLILSHHLGKYVTYTIPEHGLTFWLKFQETCNLTVVLKKLGERGIPVPFHPNSPKTHEPVYYMILGFGAFDIVEAEGGAKMIRLIMEELEQRH